MKLKKLIAALALGFCTLTSTVNAQENPTCVLMKFTDDTRFVKVESAPSLSDLVMEKLLASGKFNLKETKFIDEDIEDLLYEERAAEFKNAQTAINSGDYSVLFEGTGFNEENAQTIATAQVGQIVSPSITSSIGKAHGAEYLIQGTIINLGTGNWMDMTVDNALSYASMVPGLGALAGSALGALGPLGGLASMFLGGEVKVTGVAVQADLRLIKADTGRVVWQKMVTGKETQKQRKFSLLGLASVKVGSDELTNEMYAEAMDNAAEAIANALIADLDAGTFFVDQN